MRIDLLGSGYVELVQAWGPESRIIEAARMSTGKGFKGWGSSESTGDEKLLRYLYQNKHLTPFEMVGATFEVMAPIFVFREWQRHRTQSYNELSARYTELPDQCYTPDKSRVCAGMQSQTAKQGSQEGISPKLAGEIQDLILASHENARQTYEKLLSVGLSRELARVVVPVGQFSRMRASANLRNWLQFLQLRLAPNAQYEIRQYAEAVQTILKSEFPRTMELFSEG